ncbi:MAG: hypothetical protein PHQ91_13155 [Thermoanaerobaculaceae bacterium]|nr:hypothetical protein [Thermoanaerobaculaceae bacterium]
MLTGVRCNMILSLPLDLASVATDAGARRTGPTRRRPSDPDGSLIRTSRLAAGERGAEGAAA